MTALPQSRGVAEHGLATAADFAALAAAELPFVVRGLAGQWPLVAAAARAPSEALQLVAARAGRDSAEVMIGPPDQAGRFFYGPDFTGFNFRREHQPLAAVCAEIVRLADQADAPAIYAGAAETSRHWPDFEATHPLPLLPQSAVGRSRIWLSTRAQVATHFDLSANLAVVAAGHRRFTLFPPSATGDLYVGPFNHTLAGQPVSMVDPLAPDLAVYPRYAAAQREALVAELGPGDAIYIPPIWWHHVEACDPINLLVNYWHEDAAHGGPFLAFIHALWAIRDLPAGQREGWRAWFDHFVFGPDATQAADHLPPAARGVNGPATPERSAMIRQFMVRVLSNG